MSVYEQSRVTLVKSFIRVFNTIFPIAYLTRNISNPVALINLSMNNEVLMKLIFVVVTKLSVTKLSVTKLSGYQIVGYQIVSYQIVSYQIVSYQKSAHPIK